MSTMDATERLRYHAGYLGETCFDVPSLDYALFNKKPIDDALADVIATLNTLNIEINGPIPSETIETSPALFPRQLVGAVTEIVRRVREEAVAADNAETKRELLRIAWRLDCAWSAILDGDIDDLEEHVDGQESARQPTFE